MSNASKVSAKDKDINRQIAEAKAQKMAGHMTEEQFQEMKKVLHMQKDNPHKHLLEKYHKKDADQPEQERLRQEKEKSWEEQEYSLRKASHEFIEELNRLHAQRLEEANRFFQEQLRAMHIKQQEEGRTKFF